MTGLEESAEHVSRGLQDEELAKERLSQEKHEAAKILVNVSLDVSSLLDHALNSPSLFMQTGSDDHGEQRVPPAQLTICFCSHPRQGWFLLLNTLHVCG